MTDFLQYMLRDVKAGRLSKQDALEFIRQFKTQTGSGGVSFLHPLLHVNSSDIYEQRFGATFTGREFFLADHRVGGKRVLPGAACIEMAREAVDRSAGARENGKYIRLKNMVWMRPVIVEDEPVGVHIRLLPGENEEIAFDICTESDSGDDIVYSSGVAELCDSERARVLDIDSLKSACGECELNPDELYGAFESMGIEYGPAHRGIESVRVGGGMALAGLSLPASVADTETQFVLHPGLLDSAFQAAAGFMVSDADIRPMLPYAIKTIEVHGPFTSNMWALLRYKGESSEDGVQLFDIDICTESGEVRTRIGEIAFRPMIMRSTPGISETPPAVTLGMSMFRPSWKERAVEESGSPEFEHLVAVCGMEGVSGKRIEDGLEGARCLVFESGENNIAERFRACADGVFDEIRNILLDKPKGKTLVQVVASFDGEHRLFRGVSGLLKTARSENPNIVGQLIEVEPGLDSDGVLQILEVNRRDPVAGDIRHDAGKRYLAEWEEIEVSRREAAAPWKDGGVYLITGGAGGLGRIFAHEIAGITNRPVLILTGRSEIDDRTSNLVEELKASGASVEYMRVDIAKQAEVESLFQLICGKFGNLNGIIHCAGVIRDNFIIKKGKEEFKSVLAPKVGGAANLDHASRDMDLDFLALFSSVAGALGNAGQADYACANAFMDAFARWRNELADQNLRKGQTLSINWPLWKEGGMGVERDGSLENMLLEQTGIAPLPSPDGVRAFYRAMALGHAQVMVMNGDLRRIRQALFSVPAPETPVSTDRLEEAVRLELTNMLSGLLNVNSGDIAPDMEFDDLGLDPVRLAELAETINHEFQLDLTPNTFFEHTSIGSITDYLVTRYRELLTERFPDTVSDRTSREKADLPAIDPDLFMEKAREYFKAPLSAVIKLPAHRIDADDPLERYGIDSVMVMNLTNLLEKDFGALPKTLFFEYQTIREIAGYFVEFHRDRLIDVLGMGKREPDAASVPEPVAEPVRPKPRLADMKRTRFASIGRAKPIESPDIAIIGLSGRYPLANDVNEFWRNLSAGRDCVTEIPGDRWNHDLYFDEDKDAPGKTYSKWGGFIDGVDRFDPFFFNISPREAEIMEPQERLFLQCAFNTLEDAGYIRNVPGMSPHGSGLGNNVGVFVGIMYEEYQLYGAQAMDMGIPTPLPGNSSSAANRVSYFFNFNGPSMAVDTMCSSSLTTLHLACRGIQQGDCELAIAGGVNVSIHPSKYLLLGLGKFVSSKGRCESFGKGGDGYVPGEGVGAVLLKPLARAVADGDHIYGVIRGTAVNHGGKTNGYTVPNPNAQAGVIGRALEIAGIDPRTVSYLEAHGTGTSLGDPIEIAGLTKTFRKYTQDSRFCAIGSAKSNIGHLESAAGIAGLTKILMQLRHKKLAPSLHSETLNPNIDFDNTPFVVQQALAEWKRPVIAGKEIPRRAGISAFGAGGSNAHVIIEEYIPEEQRSSVEVSDRNPAVILLSARTGDQLRERAGRLAEAVRDREHGGANLADIAYTLQVGREAMDERLAAVVRSAEELGEKLAGFIDGRADIPDLYLGEVKRNREVLSAFTADEDMARTIDTWVSKGKFARLSQLWVQGLPVDWSRLYGDAKPRRVNLPGYPFAEKRYWVPEIDGRAFEEFVPPAEYSVPVESPPEIEALSTGDLKQKIRKDVVRTVAGILKAGEHDIDPEDDMSAHGFDSVTLTKLADRISKTYNISVTPDLFFEHKTINSFIDHLDNAHTDRLSEFYRVKTTPAAKPQRRPARAIQMVPTAKHVRTDADMPVAIIGMSGVFPMSEDLNAFWKHLEAGDDMMSEVPRDRWNWRKFYGDAMAEPNKTRVKHAGFIDGIDKFDPLFFEISPKEAELMDPQQRLSFMCVWHAIEDAGYAASELAGTNTGLFMGVGIADYLRLINERVPVITAHATTGNTFSILPNRISYFLDLRGPSEPVDTACSSSLVTIHRSVEAIRSGAIDMAIAGGVNALIHPATTISLSQGGMLSEDGRCKTFDKSADGYARGEGVGAVFLKPLDRAVRDGDHIYAVIRGTAENHGGHAASLTAPNPNAQAELLVSAWSRARIDPATAGYIEVHGTGTSLGDPIEINGLKMAFAELYDQWGKTPAEKAHCALGSVKTNIGHLENAAGIAGLIKVVLSMQNKRIPPHLHLQELNPLIKLENTPFSIMKEGREWEPARDENGNPLPRRAGVSSFGFGGVNAHVVLEEYIGSADRPESGQDSRQLIVLSAKTGENLAEMAERLVAWLEQTDAAFQDIAYTLQKGREAMNERLAMIAENIPDLTGKLKGYLDGQTGADVFEGSVEKGGKLNALVVEGKAGETYLEALFQENDLEKIAQLWLTDAEIDWDLLHKGRNPKRIPLPGYPFTKMRCWVPDAEEDEEDLVHYYETEWEQTETGDDSESLPGPVLLLSGNSELRDALGKKTDSDVVMVRPGGEYGEEGKDAYAIDPGEYGHYVKMFKALAGNGLVPETVVHVWSWNTGEPMTAIRSIYCLINAALENKLDLNRFLFVYNQAGDEHEPMLEAVSGFVQSLAPIWPALRFSTIKDMAGDMAPDDLAGKIVRESGFQDTGLANEIRYEGGDRFVKKAVSLELKDEQKIVFRERGVYLVTGGAGGLGMIYSTWLAENYKARLVLTGRSPMDETIRAKLAGLQKAGGEAIYVPADAGESKDLQKVMDAIVEKFGELNGVLHMAGISTRIPVNQKSLEEFEITLKPKVQGTILLDEMTAGQPLDCFILFTSISSFLGDFGQCDYAVANRFLESHAEKREALREKGEREGRTIAIHWPLFREGGIHWDEDVESLYLRTTGLAYVENEDGLAALEAIAASSHNHAIVMKGALPRIEQLMKLREVEAAPPPQAADVDLSGIEIDTGMSLVAMFKEVASKVVGLKPEEIDENENMGQFGFDSLTLNEFALKLNSLLDIKLTPVIFFANATIQALADHIESEFAEEVNAFRSRTEAVPKPAPAPQKAAPKVETPGAMAPPVAEPGEDIAIIGAHGIFPGSKDLDEFWRHLEAETDLITEIPKDRWNWESVYGDPSKERGKTNIKYGGFISGADTFDPLFFKISPNEAGMMDPQQRKFLEVVWKTIEDGGYGASDISGKAIGVFAGVQYNDYQHVIGKADYNAFAATGNVQSVITNRASYFFNIHGPSVSIDTACSSSLVAIHQAVTAIRNGECEAAIAGGVSLILSPETTIMLSRLNVLSPDGRCKTFDASANGYARGEGVAALMLKPLSRAVADGDNIHAVIRGSAVNHGGRASSLTAPNFEAQAGVISAAYARAGIEPETVSYIEAHGTGTNLGDPVEIEGIKKAFRDLGRERGKPIEKTGYCGLGTVKTNIGHLEPAAGIAGVIKVMLSMKHKKLPGIVHLKNLNPMIQLDDTPFYIVEKTTDWDRPGPDTPRRAGVSSFGFGGANAHVVMEEYEAPPLAERDTRPSVIVLSARQADRLEASARNLLDWLERRFSGEDRNQADILGAITSQACGILNIEQEDVDPGENLGEYGFDPVSMAELGKRIEERYGVQPDLTLFASLESIARDIGDSATIPSSDSGETDLAGIAYTLQTGREEMEERLAMVVSDISELKEKLHQYIEGKTSVGLHRGQVKAGAKSEYDGTDDPYAIAEKWVSGMKVDWNSLHPARKPRRVSLPTYPFAGKRHWAEIIKPADEPAAEKPEIMYFHGTWEPSEAFGAGPMRGNVLVFDTSDAISNELGKRLDARVIPAVPDDFGKLSADENPAVNIVWFWPQATTGVSEKGCPENLASLYFLTRSLMEQKKRKVRLLYIHETAGENIPPEHGAMNGFFNTLRLEHPGYDYSAVAVDRLEKLPEIVENELGIPGGQEILYKDGTRYIKRWKQGSIESRTNRIQLKENGVYLITGGLGGIGLIMAEHLAGMKNARIILTGRSEPGGEKLAAMENIKRNGSEIVFIRADISDRREVRMLIDDIKGRYDRLDGIIHSAGVVRDAFVMKKTMGEIEEVMGPKVYGTINLDGETRNEDLDFFVLFSSLSGVMGNQGQSDYAYANRFMDYYAEKRALENGPGKTVSISWSLWKDGGMGIAREHADVLRMKTGIMPMPAEQGMAAWETAVFDLGLPHCAVIHGDREKVEKSIREMDRRISVKASAVYPVQQSGSPDKARSKIAADLLGITSEVLSMASSDIDPGENLGLYGFDSISYTKYAEKIGDKFRIEITPVVFYENSTVNELAGYILQELGNSIMTLYPELETRPRPVAPASRPVSTDEGRPAPKPRTISGDREDIAIIGVHGVFPKSRNLKEFWRHLESETDLITEIPKDRWDWREYYGDPAKEKRKTNAKWGGFIPDVDRFDPEFFNMTPAEAEVMDPQQRIFLESSWKAIEDAGYRASDLWGRPVGVFVGFQFNDYQKLISAKVREANNHIGTGIANTMIANRISFLLNLRGPSESVDTACSSSLVAIHRAVMSIQNGESELAIAGGVSLMLTPEITIGISQLGILSPDGRCKTFDKSANGYVRGEGIGALVLKPLGKALEDNDNIHGVIKASAVNHGGRASSLTSPNSEAQAELLITAYEAAGMDPDTISYIETHGTGTALGDPVEIEGIKRAFRELDARRGRKTTRTNYCGLGSIKTNIGHLEPAAGIAGVIKVLLSMKHGKLPGTVHLKTMNPYIRLKDTPFYIVEQTRQWDRPADESGNRIPRRAGVSSFGFGGANAHVVVEEFEPPETASMTEREEERIIILSAKNKERLAEYAQSMSDGVKNSGHSLGDIAYTLQVGREAMDERIALVVSTKRELADKLKKYADGETGMDRFFHGNVKADKDRFGLLVDGEAGAAFIRVAIEQRESDKLARLWVTAVEIDWELLYQTENPRRASLPTYPFYRERHWIRESEKQPAPVIKEEEKKRISPVASVPGMKRLSGQESITLSEHERRASLKKLEDEFSAGKADKRELPAAADPRPPGLPVEKFFVSLTPDQRRASSKNLENEFGAETDLENEPAGLPAERFFTSLTENQRRESYERLKRDLGS